MDYFGEFLIEQFFSVACVKMMIDLMGCGNDFENVLPMWCPFRENHQHTHDACGIREGAALSLKFACSKGFIGAMHKFRVGDIHSFIVISCEVISQSDCDAWDKGYLTGYFVA